MADGILAGMLVFIVAFGLHGVKAEIDGRDVRRRMKNVPKANWPDIRMIVSRLRPVSQHSYEKQLPVVLDAIALSLYSGSGFTQAIRETARHGRGPVVDDMRQIVHAVEMGESLADALQQWAQRVHYQSVRLCAASMVMAIESGGNYVVAIDAAAAAVRRSVEATATATTNATQSRASAAALVGLPLVISGPLIMFNSGARAFMLHTFVGFSFLVVGIALDVVGWLWMQSLVKRTLS